MKKKKKKKKHRSEGLGLKINSLNYKLYTKNTKNNFIKSVFCASQFRPKTMLAMCSVLTIFTDATGF